MIKTMQQYILILVLISCHQKKYEMVLTNDELVHAMVEMYTINAALDINDPSLKDSMSSVYFIKVAELTGHSPELVKNDFDNLILMPDSLLMIQGRALDTLRFLQDKSTTTSPISIGLQ